MSDEVTPEKAADAATVDVVEKDEPLGEGGLKALRAEREKAAAAEKARSDLEAKLREYEDRDKSEEQKSQEERDRLSKEIADLTTAKTRAEVAAASAVPTEILAGPKSGSVEDIQAFADALTAWRGDVPAARGPVVPGQGKTPDIAPGSKVEAFAQALGI